MSGANGRDTVLLDVCLYVCVCVCVCAQWTGQSDQFKMVKATDIKFNAHVSRNSLDMTDDDPLKIFRKRGVDRVTLPPHFWALNANSSKTVTAMTSNLTCMLSETVHM